MRSNSNRRSSFGGGVLTRPSAQLTKTLQGDLGSRSADKESVAAFLGRWLTATAGTLRAQTHADYSDIVRLHLAPTLGRRRLTALRPEHVQAFHAVERPARALNGAS